MSVESIWCRLVSLAACGSLLGCAHDEAEASQDVARLPVTTPEIQNVVIARELVAEIRAVRHAELRSRFKGVLESVSVDEGQAVKAGQTLFSVNTQALEKELLVARAQTLGAQAELETAELELGNTRLLHAKNIVSAAELELAKAKVKTLRARLEQAKATADRARVELGFAKITAPFDGVINRIPRRAGSTIAEHELLTTITDTSDVFAYFRLTEREYLEWRATDDAERPRTVALALADGSTFPEKGTVDAIATEFDRETGTLAYRARFPNPAGILKHGSSGRVVLETELRSALLVPQKATFDVQGDVHVYVVDDRSTARMRKVVVKARHGDAFVVERGLAKGERFILEGTQKVKDGDRIEIAKPTANKPATTPGR